jgi:hypothetical protein
MFFGHHSWRVGEPVADPSEDQSIVPAEALAAPHGLQHKYWKEITLGEGATAGAEANLTATILAAVRLREG